MNQVEQEGSRKKCMRYKPRNISELSAFVAAIRPGFKSMYSKFENREEFSYGLPTLDNLIQTEQFPYSYMIYQENIMSVLHYAGFPMDQCYGIIKSIAKKHPEKVLPLKSQFIEGFKENIIRDEHISEEKADEYSVNVWQIINDNVSYSFNSSHAYSVALDSLYQAWQKANYPYEFYETLLQHYSDKGNKSKVAALKTEMKSAFGIVEGEYKFGNDNRHFSSDKENHVIYPALSSIKRVSQKTANILYKLGENKYDTFLDLLVDMKKNRINATNINILTKLDYFSEFGEIHQLIKQYQYFDELYGGVQLSKTKVEKLGLPEDIVLRNSLSHTAKTYMKVNMPNLLKEYFSVMPYPKTTIADKAYYQFVNLGYIDIVDKSAKGCVVVLDVNTLYTPRIKVYALANGNTLYVKVAKKLFRENPFDVGCVLKINNQKKKNRLRKLEDGTFQKIPDEFEWWITDYFILRKPD